MLKLLNYCYQRDLTGRLSALLTVSTVAAVLSILFADRFAAWIQLQMTGGDTHVAWAHVVSLVLLFAGSTLSSLFAEYQSQTLSARIAGCLGADFIKRFRFKEVSASSIEAAKSDITAILLNQMERYRQDYLMMVTSALTRIIILSTLTIYLLVFYPLQTMLTVVAGGLFLMLTYFAMRSLARLVDSQITRGNQELGDIVARTSRTVLSVVLGGIRSEVIRQYLQSYRSLGQGRGLNGVLSLLPKSIMELVALLVLLVYALANGGITVKSEVLVYIAALVLKFNPHLQILIKNLSVMQTTRRAGYLIELDEPENVAKKRADALPADASVTIDGVRWPFRRQKWFRVMGPSGAGKTTFLLKVVNQLQKDGVSVAMIQNNDDLPLFTFAGDGLDKAMLMDDINQMGLGHVLQRLAEGSPDTWKIDGLSNGERQRVLIAMAIRTGACVLVLDEGLSALDDASLSLVLKYLASKDVSILFCCHGQAAHVRNELGDKLHEHHVKPVCQSSALADISIL
jgi:ABC-type transport system involved in cytochrome bd biosynthesis fused ATPase/permease subunit